MTYQYVQRRAGEVVSYGPTVTAPWGKLGPGAPPGGFIPAQATADGWTWEDVPDTAPTLEGLAAAVAKNTADIAKVTDVGAVFRFRAKAPSITGDPGPGFIRWNNVTQINSTVLAIDVKDQDDLDVTVGLASLVVGTKVSLQDFSEAVNYQTWTVIGASINRTGWWDIPVMLTLSGGVGTTNFVNGQMLAMRVVRPGLAPPPPVQATLLPAQPEG